MKIDRVKLAVSVEEMVNDLGQIRRDLSSLEEQISKYYESWDLNPTLLYLERCSSLTEKMFDELYKIEDRLLDDRDWLQNLEYQSQR